MSACVLVWTQGGLPRCECGWTAPASDDAMAGLRWYSAHQRHEAEYVAMGKITDALEPLDAGARERVLRWADTAEGHRRAAELVDAEPGSRTVTHAVLAMRLVESLMSGAVAALSSQWGAHAWRVLTEEGQ